MPVLDSLTSISPKIIADYKDPTRPAIFNPNISNLYLKALYSVMLTEFDLESVREFWKARISDLSADGRIKEEELYQRLWQENGTFPLDFVQTTMDCLEQFTVWKSANILGIVDKMCLRVNRGSVIPGKLLLHWLKPALPLLLRAADPRDFLFKAMALVSERYIPGCINRAIRVEKNQGFTTAWVLYIPDKKFSGLYPSDYHLFGAQIICRYPRALGGTPIDESFPIADMRKLKEILWQVDHHLVGDIFFIAGKPFGRKKRLHDHCAFLLPELKKVKVPDSEIIVIEKEYYCPLRQRIVLFPACGYEAPTHIEGFRWKKAGKIHGRIDSLVDDLIAEELGVLKSVERIHLHLLEQVAFRIIFEYHSEAQAILLNGKTLISGVPAKILRKILLANEKGQTTFDFRSFKYDQDIFSNTKNSSFETRWNRLRDKLAEATSLVRLEKTGIGEFSFKSNCPVEFQEIF